MPAHRRAFGRRAPATALACGTFAFTLACGAVGGNSAGSAPAAAPPPPAEIEQTLTFGPVGQVHVLRPALPPRHVLLFVSGDGGWNRGAADMARSLAGGDSLVLGVDIETYRKIAARGKASCTYAAADLEGLSKLAQLQLGLPAYRPPVLVGYSSGAALVYAALAQAPPNTFRGAVSLGFCPSLDFPKPLCKGSGLASTPGTPEGGTGSTFQPVARLGEPWVAVFGEQDAVCPPKNAEDFVRHVAGSSFQVIPKESHELVHPDAWVPPVREAIDRMEQGAEARRVRITAPAVSDLPLVEVPAAASQPPENRRRFAVILSGDGGWAGLDREVAGALAARGIPTAGWNTLDYFWKPRTPEGGAKDLERVLRHYLDAWKRDRVLLIGYSLGADVLPFFASRLPPDLLDRVELVALLGPGRSTSFEFHVTDWLGGSSGDAHPVLPEVHKLSGRRLLCLYGKEEDDSLCPLLAQPKAETFAFSGAHHFGGSYEAVADRILAALGPPP